MSCHVMSCHVLSCLVMSCHVLSCLLRFGKIFVRLPSEMSFFVRILLFQFPLPKCHCIVHYNHIILPRITIMLWWIYVRNKKIKNLASVLLPNDRVKLIILVCITFFDWWWMSMMQPTIYESEIMGLTTLYSGIFLAYVSVHCVNGRYAAVEIEVSNITMLNNSVLTAFESPIFHCIQNWKP